MSLCIVLGVLAIALSGFVVFLLTDGGVRRALHLLLIRRLGALFLPRVIILGDSLAAGCPWVQLYKSPFAVLNLAEGGATLKQITGQALLARDFVGASLLIDGGLNDLLFDHASLEQFEVDCRALFTRIGSHRIVIVLLMPFTADSGDTGRIVAANAVLSKLCGDHGFHALDLNGLISTNGVRKTEMTNDGLHFTGAAETLWMEAVKEILGQTTKDIV